MQDTDKNVIASAFHILLDEIHGNAVDHGFWETVPDGRVLTDKRNKGEMIALEMSELAERLEAIRNPEERSVEEGGIKHTIILPRRDQHCPEFTSEEIEWADLIIRAFDYAKAFNIRAAEAVFAKHMYNKSRPFKHGKKF